MKFLVDNCLSWIVCDQLRGHGYDVVHVRDYGLQEAEDVDIFRKASEEQLVIISADTDFGLLLADSGVNTPSVIIFRGSIDRSPAAIVQKLLEILHNPSIYDALKVGAIVVVGNSKTRTTLLPIGQ